MLFKAQHMFFVFLRRKSYTFDKEFDESDIQLSVCK